MNEIPIRGWIGQLQIKATSSQNARLHWRAKAERAAEEKGIAHVACRLAAGLVGPAIEIRLTRVGPRELDDDNLAGSLKAVRDGVASALRIDDGSKLIRWTYAQERGEYAVRVRIERLP